MQIFIKQEVVLSYDEGRIENDASDNSIVLLSRYLATILGYIYIHMDGRDLSSSH